jgi:hypothetical protein
MEVVLFIPGFFHYRQQKLRAPPKEAVRQIFANLFNLEVEPVSRQ